MAKFTLSPDDLERVAHDRYHHPCPQIQKRMEVLWLASHANLIQEAVAELAGVGLASVQRFLATYRREGLDAVQRRNYVGPASGFEPYTSTLEEHFRLHQPATVAEASEAITRLTGVRRGLTQVRLFLKAIGLAVPQGPGRSRQHRPARPGRVSGWYFETPAGPGRRG